MDTLEGQRPGRGQVEPEDHGLDLVAKRLRLGDLVEQATRRQPKARVRVELRHEVVIVGVEPLGHLERGPATARRLATSASLIVHMLGSHAARHREVARQLGLISDEAEARRLAAEHLDVVGNVVVVRKVANRDEVQPGIALQRPVPRTKFPAGGRQRVGIGLAAPVALQGDLQLALGTLRGKPRM